MILGGANAVYIITSNSITTTLTIFLLYTINTQIKKQKITSAGAIA